jgi:CBS domain-containing protein
MKKAEKYESVADVYKMIIREPTVVVEGMKVSEAVSKLLKNPKKRNVYVVDDTNRLTGIITVRELVKMMGLYARINKEKVFSLADCTNKLLDAYVEDVMTCHFAAVQKDEELTKILREMEVHQLEDLPVVDDDGKLVGVINGLEILAAGKALYSKMKRCEK